MDNTISTKFTGCVSPKPQITIFLHPLTTYKACSNLIASNDVVRACVVENIYTEKQKVYLKDI